MLTYSAVFCSKLSICEILTLDEGANEEDREGGGAAGLRGPRQEGDDDNNNDDDDMMMMMKVFHLCIVNLVIGTLYCAKEWVTILPEILILLQNP